MILADTAMDLRLYAVIVMLLASLAAVVVMTMTRREWTRDILMRRLGLATMAIVLFAGGLVLLTVPCAPFVVGVSAAASTAILIMIGPRAIDGIATA